MERTWRVAMVGAGRRRAMGDTRGGAVVDSAWGSVSGAGRVYVWVGVVKSVTFLAHPAGGCKEQVGLAQFRRRAFGLDLRTSVSRGRWGSEMGWRLDTRLHFVLKQE